MSSVLDSEYHTMVSPVAMENANAMVSVMINDGRQLIYATLKRLTSSRTHVIPSTSLTFPPICIHFILYLEVQIADCSLQKS